MPNTELIPLQPNSLALVHAFTISDRGITVEDREGRLFQTCLIDFDHVTRRHSYAQGENYCEIAEEEQFGTFLNRMFSGLVLFNLPFSSDRNVDYEHAAGLIAHLLGQINHCTYKRVKSKGEKIRYERE